MKNTGVPSIPMREVRQSFDDSKIGDIGEHLTAALAAAVEAAMRAEGFSLIDRAETYDKLADLYAVETRWSGEAAL